MSKDTNSAIINTTSQEEDARNSSQSSASGTTGPGSFQVVSNGEREFEMEDSRDEKTGMRVDQGVDILETPRALYTTGEGVPRTGYEPKPSSTKVVGGVLKQTEDKKTRSQVPLVPPLCTALVGTLGNLVAKGSTH